MSELQDAKLERIAQLVFHKKPKETKRDLCNKMEEGLQYEYFCSLSRKPEVKERILELKTEDKNKDIMGKEARLKTLTNIINTTDDTDVKIKAIQALDKIDDRTEAETDSTVKQVVIQLPDNKRN